MNTTLVFFIYGLAFFSMGLAMFLESLRSPVLAEGPVLRPLAWFGLLHGVHEWLEMAADLNVQFVTEYPLLFGWFRLGLLALSFVALLAFGLRVLRPRPSSGRREWLNWMGLILGGLLVTVAGAGLFRQQVDWITPTDALIRYLLAVPSAFLAALALNLQAVQTSRENQAGLALMLRGAAAGFGLYALSQWFVPPAHYFPASLINSAVFLNVSRVPVQVVRAGLALWITASLLRATQVADEERQKQLATVRQARLDAVERLRLELVEREQMRRELLRHTVIAQEDERARIARELHDETAQMLTAFTLHLAALKDVAAENPKAAQNVSQLQELSRQMSQGIYRLVHDLRPAQLDDLGLVAALRYLADEERKHTRLAVKLAVEGRVQRLDALVETVLFRVAQEALNNVARHAGVTQAELKLRFDSGQVMLQVVDQGCGFDLRTRQQPPQGWGLAGMRERVESVGGRFELYSELGKGTRVQVSVAGGTLPASSSLR